MGTITGATTGQAATEHAGASDTAADEVRVLAVEASPTQAEVLQAFLHDASEVGPFRFDVTCVGDLATAVRELADGHDFDIVLLDLSLPDSSGLDTLDAVRAATATPVVVLSEVDEQDGFEVVRRGAQDFVPKDVHALAELPRVIRHALSRAALSEELAQALVAREDADARLRTFVSMASHELRSPLASLQGMTTVLVEKWDEMADDDRRMVAGRIQRRFGHALAVATLYLNAAGKGEHTIHAVPTSIDLATLCRDAAATVPNPPDEVDAARELVTFDASHLVSIIVNLLTNAAKYGAKPVRLEADARRIVVSDHGPGVPEADVAGLFQPWRKRARDGHHSTGLGLALAAQLATANGAELRYERVDGVTRFVVVFGDD